MTTFWETVTTSAITSGVVAYLMKFGLDLYSKNYLGQREANRQYQLEARNRLYTAIEPLKFQLIIASHDLASRVAGILKREDFEINLTTYYGRSFLYRMLRPFAICDLIERQMTYIDLSIDKSTMELLHFNKCIKQIFSGSDIIRKVEPSISINWQNQTEHVFYDNLPKVANSMLVTDGNNKRCMRFDEFEKYLDESDIVALHPFPNLFTNLSLNSKPIFWLRIFTYAWLCNELVAKNNKNLELGHRTFPFADLIDVLSCDYKSQLLDSADSFLVESKWMSKKTSVKKR